MTIPTISSYPLPRGASLPANKMAWSPSPARAALLIHDMQDYFLRFYDRDAQPLATVLENVARIAATCRMLGVPVLYSVQPADQTAEQRGLLTDVWGPGLTAHPEAESIAYELRPMLGDTVLPKVRYSAFHRTELLQILRQNQRDQLIICGVYAHIGCQLTACDAFMHDVQPFFVTDGVADFSQQHHEQALAYVTERCAVTIETAALLASLGGADGRELSREAIRVQVAAALELESSELDEEEDLFDLGLDSIRLMSLVETFRARGAAVSFADLAECRTLQALSAMLATVAA